MIEESDSKPVTLRGDKGTFDPIVSLLYQEPHRIAGVYPRREHRPATLQPTALVNEAYVRLAGRQQSMIFGKAGLDKP